MYEELIGKINTGLHDVRELETSLEAWLLAVLNRERPSPHSKIIAPSSDIRDRGAALAWSLADIASYINRTRTDEEG